MNPKKVKFNSQQLDGGQCLPVQLKGLSACKTCPHKDITKGDEKCPSPEIRKTGKNSLGHPVPVQQMPAPRA